MPPPHGDEPEGGEERGREGEEQHGADPAAIDRRRGPTGAARPPFRARVRGLGPGLGSGAWVPGLGRRGTCRAPGTFSYRETSIPPRPSGGARRLLTSHEPEPRAPRSGAGRAETRDESIVLARQGRHPLRHGPRSPDRGCARRHHQGDLLRDLRLGPPPHGRADAHHGERRRARPRVHGRGGGGRRRLHEVQKGDRIVVPFNINCGECRQCRLGNYSVCQRSNRNGAMAAASSATPRPACSATRTSPAAMPAARPSTCACPWRMSPR